MKRIFYLLHHKTRKPSQTQVRPPITPHRSCKFGLAGASLPYPPPPGRVSRQPVPPGHSQDGPATPRCHSPAPPAITLRNGNRRAFASPQPAAASTITFFYMALRVGPPHCARQRRDNRADRGPGLAPTCRSLTS